MLKTKVFENWRTFDPEGFETDVKCSLCNNPSSNYLEFCNDESPILRICRGCLSDGYEELCKSTIDYIKKIKRSVKVNE